MTTQGQSQEERRRLLDKHHHLAEYSFMPVAGYCYRCNGDVLTFYQHHNRLDEPVSGCPYCHRSFVG